VGVPSDVVAYFSARRATIEEQLATAGTTSDAAPASTLAGRNPSIGIRAGEHHPDRTKSWHGGSIRGSGRGRPDRRTLGTGP
jgi:hypothetical protein